MIRRPKIDAPCVEEVRDKKIKFSGQKTSTLYLLNPDRQIIERIKVDGCAIREGRRCDWMARINADEIFIELKRALRIGDAVAQLEISMDRLSAGAAKAKRLCVIVCTRARVAATDLQNDKLRFKQKLRAELRVVRDGDSIALSA
jgi:hypothetical protein